MCAVLFSGYGADDASAVACRGLARIHQVMGETALLGRDLAANDQREGISARRGSKSLAAGDLIAEHGSIHQDSSLLGISRGTGTCETSAICAGAPDGLALRAVADAAMTAVPHPATKPDDLP